MSDKNTLEEFLSSSFDDQRLSRNEASVFRSLLEEWNPNSNEQAWLRSHIFNLAESALKDSRDKPVLGWVESLFKAMAANDASGHIEEEVLFFPSEESLQKLLRVIKSSRRSLDICVFTITDNRISRAISDAHDRGVKVRIITDDDKAMDLGSDVIDLGRYGIPVRYDNTPNHMHNKFALVDGQTLINGSFNWTRSASSHNSENVVFSNSPFLLKRFQEEFDKLWDDFDHGGQ